MLHAGRDGKSGEMVREGHCCMDDGEKAMWRRRVSRGIRMGNK